MASGASNLAHGGVAHRYARALYSLANDQACLDQTIDEMVKLGQLIDASAALRQVLASPLVNAKQAVAALRAVLQEEGFSALLQRFVGVIAVNRRLAVLRTIVNEFAQLAAHERGEITAQVTTAHPLSESQRAALVAQLAGAGHARITLAEEVDPSLLGGLKLRVGARLFDSSIKSRLQRLQHAMKGAA